MVRRSATWVPAWANPLDDPLAVALAGLLLVALARLTPLGRPLALLVAVFAAWILALLRDRQRRRGARLSDGRVSAGIEAAVARAVQLAGHAALVSREAMARFQDPAHLEALGLVQLCCEGLLESGGGVLLSADDLSARLAREEESLRRERSATLRPERQRLVDQHWPSSAATDAAMAEAIAPLDDGLDQIDRLLDAGQC